MPPIPLGQSLEEIVEILRKHERGGSGRSDHATLTKEQHERLLDFYCRCVSPKGEALSILTNHPYGIVLNKIDIGSCRDIVLLGPDTDAACNEINRRIGALSARQRGATFPTEVEVMAIVETAFRCVPKRPRAGE